MLTLKLFPLNVFVSTSDISETNSLNTTITTYHNPKQIDDISLHQITPEQIAKHEKILEISALGEELFRTWTTIDVDVQVLEECVKFIHDANNRSNINNKMIILLKVTLLKPNILNSLLIPLKQRFNPSVLYRTYNNETYEYIPQILLKEDASSDDIFRSLVIVNRIVHNIESITRPYRSQSTILSIGKLNQESLMSVDTIVKIIRDGYEFESNNIEYIKDILKSCGWDLKMHMYGDIKLRVDWFRL
jgi:hypothetical protein